GYEWVGSQERAATHAVGFVKLLDIATGREQRTLRFPRVRWGSLFGHALRALAFTTDGKTLAVSGQAQEGETVLGVIKVWDVASGQERGTFPGPRQVQTLAFSPDGKTLAL